MFEIITASHNEEILKANLMASKIRIPVQVIRNCDNVAKAYNSAIVSEKSIKVWVHHDVYLPEGFFDNLSNCIKALPENWDICGVAGVHWYRKGKRYAGHLLDRGREWKYGVLPQKVDTLDELILITRTPVKFDEQFDLHFYGADICMGKNCYAIDAYVHHNSGLPLGYRSQSFRDCERKFATKYKQRPLITTCSTIL